MKKTIQSPSKTVVMVFEGEYDLSSKQQLRAAFDSLSGASRVALDFSDVTYVDTTVIAELVRLHKVRADNNLEREVLVMRNPNLVRLFDITHLSSAFRIVEALDEAIGKNGEQIVVQYASSFDGVAAPRRNGSITSAAG